METNEKFMRRFCNHKGTVHSMGEFTVSDFRNLKYAMHDYIESDEFSERLLNGEYFVMFRIPSVPVTNTLSFNHPFDNPEVIDRAHDHGLNDDEIITLRIIRDGKTYQQVAEILSATSKKITADGIKYRIGRINEKMDTSTAHEAVQKLLFP